MSRFQNISDEEFTTIVKQNDCIRDIVGALGYSRSSGSMGVKVNERINALNIDISHFAKKKSDASSHPLYSLEEILVENSKYENINQFEKANIKRRSFRI